MIVCPHSFSSLRARYKKWTGKSFEDTQFESFGIVDDSGKLTNAGALLADNSPIKYSRVFCTRWNGLDKANGKFEAFDSDEFSGGIIELLNNAEQFINGERQRIQEKNFLNISIGDILKRLSMD